MHNAIIKLFNDKKHFSGTKIVTSDFTSEFSIIYFYFTIQLDKMF